MPKNGRIGSIVKRKQAERAALKATSGKVAPKPKAKAKVKQPHEMTAAEYQADYQAKERVKEATAEAKRQKAKAEAKAAEPSFLEKVGERAKEGIATAKKVVRVIRTGVKASTKKKRPKIKVTVKKKRTY